MDHPDGFPIVEDAGGLISEAMMGETSLILEQDVARRLRHPQLAEQTDILTRVRARAQVIG